MMNDTDTKEKGIRWWMRHVVVPLFGSGGVAAIVVVLLSHNGSEDSQAARPATVDTTFVSEWVLDTASFLLVDYRAQAPLLEESVGQIQQIQGIAFGTINKVPAVRVELRISNPTDDFLWLPLDLELYRLTDDFAEPATLASFSTDGGQFLAPGAQRVLQFVYELDIDRASRNLRFSTSGQLVQGTWEWALPPSAAACASAAVAMLIVIPFGWAWCRRRLARTEE